ncbi:unnamed protein product [Rotaria sp. Silwood2]|nr:unnamed protein product [Rotaria sp. Silwood2]CAF2884844.1 unnamed protein product [Rotaria sp. Silwood2]CAF3874046.1 unnamed protein product [Rotaria sp. Silwood2]CAF4383390.1 unnamed protein product [Rotaria sp. Silwood2]
MMSNTPSIIEEDEDYDNDQYNYDRLQVVMDRPVNTNLVKNQNEQFPQLTSPIATGLSSWRISRFLLNFLSISPNMLAQAEERLYQDLKTKYNGEYISIRGDYLIWTVRSLNSSKTAIPIVLIHDFGCASGIWIRNIDFLSTRHPLYMFDLLGFGRSSRPNFDQTNSINARTKFIESIEDWRIAVRLQTKFYLVGHGFGAYLATLYTMTYGQFIKKLILLDPWGFNPKPDENQLNLSTPLWIKIIAYIMQTWTSFSAFRYLGPLGLPLLKIFAPRWKRLAPMDSSTEKSNALYEYLYYVNAQPASGDLGFQALASWYGWAKDPIVQIDHSNIETISDDISIAFIYGSRTNIDNTGAHQILHQRGLNNTCIKIIHNAAHFFFMEKPIQFHEVMSDILSDLPQNFCTLASGDRTITTTVLSDRFRTIESLKRLTWNNTGPEKLVRAEMKIFETLRSQFQGRYINVLNDTQKVWTVCSNLTSNNIPIVLVHGFGGGVGLWSLNLDQLCADRAVYALDLPGFAHSSRPIFSMDPDEAEQQFVNILEEWRIGVGLNERFILLGHSFGGFLSASYAIRYPDYIEQLVLVDPWGFGRKPDNWQTSPMQRIPPWLRSFSAVMMKISPLAGLRVAGPFGIHIMKYFRPDLRVKFEKLFNDDRILEYLYHCNAQVPTGEQAFRTISDLLAWAKKPMIDRIHLIDQRIPIYFLHGEQSWIEINSSMIAQGKRDNVYIDTIQAAGHHVYADAPDEFDMYLKRILINRN